LITEFLLLPVLWSWARAINPLGKNYFLVSCLAFFASTETEYAQRKRLKNLELTNRRLLLVMRIIYGTMLRSMVHRPPILIIRIGLHLFIEGLSLPKTSFDETLQLLVLW
jgi:hypothetical protein